MAEPKVPEPDHRPLNFASLFADCLSLSELIFGLQFPHLSSGHKNTYLLEVLYKSQWTNFHKVLWLVLGIGEVLKKYWFFPFTYGQVQMKVWCGRMIGTVSDPRNPRSSSRLPLNNFSGCFLCFLQMGHKKMYHLMAWYTRTFYLEILFSLSLFFFFEVYMRLRERLYIFFHFTKMNISYG